MTLADATDWIKAVGAALAILGPYAILPAFEAVRRLWLSYRGLLVAARVFADRERRMLDLMRRLAYNLGGDEKRPGLLPVLRSYLQQQGLPPMTETRLQVLHADLMEIHRQVDNLRDTAWRAKSLERQRISGESIFQGDLDARRLHVLTNNKGE